MHYDSDLKMKNKTVIYNGRLAVVACLSIMRTPIILSHRQIFELGWSLAIDFLNKPIG